MNNVYVCITGFITYEALSPGGWCKNYVASCKITSQLGIYVNLKISFVPNGREKCYENCIWRVSVIFFNAAKEGKNAIFTNKLPF